CANKENALKTIQCYSTYSRTWTSRGTGKRSAEVRDLRGFAAFRAGRPYRAGKTGKTHAKRTAENPGEKKKPKCGIAPHLPRGLRHQPVRNPPQTRRKWADWGIMKKATRFAETGWRMGWDSNPRYAFGVYTLSRRAP